VKELNEITGAIVDAGYRIHSRLGPGMFESVYERVLEHDLLRRRFSVERQVPVSIEFEGMHFENAFKLDLLVDGRVIVEVKSVEAIARVHEKQLHTYLRLTDCRVGLLINFNVPIIKAGIRRIANGS
jgi:iron complex transport system substrate-binding protein